MYASGFRGRRGSPAVARGRPRGTTFSAFSFWAGPESEKKWWRPDRANVSLGRTREPVCIYAETPPRLTRKLGAFDVTPEPSLHELDVYLRAGETVRTDAARLFRSRPPNYRNPLAEKDGQPGVAYRWMEVEGPILDEWPTSGQRLITGDLPLKSGPKNGRPAAPLCRFASTPIHRLELIITTG